MWPWLTIVALLAGDPAPPASCVEDSPTPVQELDRSTAVFSGMVVGRRWVREPFVPEYSVGASRIEEEQFRPGEERTVERVWVLLTVDRVWKGDVPAGLWMYTANVRYPRGLYSAEAHEFDLREGSSYLIYAFGPPDRLQTSICQRTRLLRDAAEDLRALGEGRPPIRS